VQRAAIVPKHEIAGTAMVRVDEPILLDVLEQIVEQCAAFLAIITAVEIAGLARSIGTRMRRYKMRWSMAIIPSRQRSGAG
jgi:hypothetical protein